MKQLCHWLKANKISLNSKKTELIIFRSPYKKLDYDIKIKINGTKLIPSDSVKYLGILIDPYLNWSHHMDSLCTKLSRAVGMLSKIRHYVNENELRSIYFAIFNSLLSYCSIVWGQSNTKNLRRVQNIQNKALRVINFASFKDDSDIFFSKSKMLKLSDHVKLQNFLLVHTSLSNNQQKNIQNLFHLQSDVHDVNTRGAKLNKLTLSKSRTQKYGIESITYRASADWNSMTCALSKEELHMKSTSVCKKIISNSFFQKYQI